LNELLAGNTATLLGTADGTQNGYVLIIDTGGRAYLYDPDPTKQSFEPVGKLPATQAYLNHTASLRSDGTVLATGGSLTRFVLHCGLVSFSEGGADLFAPESDGFTPTGGLIWPRDSQTATALLDGSILIAGGVQRTYAMFRGGLPPTPYCERTTTVLSSAEVFK
jgi:hypothetical protein